MMKTTEDRLTYKAPALESHQRHSGFVPLGGYRADALMRTRGVAETTEFVLPGSILTDGTFAWSNDLAHYVRRHHVVVPQAFLEHCAAHDWQFPMTVDVEDLSIVPLRGE